MTGIPGSVSNSNSILFGLLPSILLWYPYRKYTSIPIKRNFVEMKKKLGFQGVSLFQPRLKLSPLLNSLLWVPSSRFQQNIYTPCARDLAGEEVRARARRQMTARVSIGESIITTKVLNCRTNIWIVKRGRRGQRASVALAMSQLNFASHMVRTFVSWALHSSKAL